jgi:hypothetical protein
VKRVARRIRYREIDALIDKTVTVSSMESIEAEISSFVQQFSPDSEYISTAEYRPGGLPSPYPNPFLELSLLQEIRSLKNWDYSGSQKNRRIR